jgi:predicted ArsR family transcriptional regulator
MEEQYRRARGLVDALSPEQIADLYVRLKAAIDGDFYVVEISEERIVLGNRRCPFGDVVRRAPGLCRMTSSVFGGIAARNTGGASVVLEERIAVGDPECRVAVWLTGAQRGRWGAAHDYGVAPGAAG